MAYIIPQNVLAYQENDIMQAVQYADSYTDTFRRPVVIRMDLMCQGRWTQPATATKRTRCL